jgi:AraC-like DNA-binding protein
VTTAIERMLAPGGTGVPDVTDLHCDAQVARRSQQEIEAGRADVWFVCLHEAGRVRFEQAGRAEHLGAGDILLLDPDIPFAMGAECAFGLRLWRVPRRRIEPDLTGRAEPQRMMRLAHGLGESRLIRTWLATLVQSSASLSADNLELAYGALCALVTQVVARTAEMPADRRQARREAQLQRVLRHIELCAGDFELTTAKLARDLALSPRTLHQLFGESDTSLHEHLTRVRLRRAYGLLRDPARSSLSTIEIGLASGFGDASTFYRRFKAHYGVTPGALRGA